MGSYLDDSHARNPASARSRNSRPRNNESTPYPSSTPVYGNGMAEPPYPDPFAFGGQPDARGRPPPMADDLNGGAHLPPPPIGDTLKPSLKRENSRSRLAPDTRAQFEDGASTLGKGPPDLERKNRPRDKAFRDLRDGYESDEGEAHRRSEYTPRRNRGGPPDDRPPRKDRARQGPPPESMVSSARGGRDRYDDEPPSYDDAPPRRRRRDPGPYDDDYAQPRRSGRDRPPDGVQYGADPIPARHRSDPRGPPRRGDRYDDGYSDEEDNRRPRRRRSLEDPRRRPRDYDEGPYYSDEPRRRRDDDYDRPRRRDRSRTGGRYDDYDDNDTRLERRDRRGDDRRGDDRREDDRRGDNRLPKEIKIGKYDVGPWVEKGQKHWGTLAPILTPLVLNYARKYMGGKGGGGGGRR